MQVERGGGGLTGEFSYSTPTGHANPLQRRRGDSLKFPREVLRARFYKNYRKVAEEYDKEFVKRYGADLNMTAMFVSLSRSPTWRTR